MNHSAIRVRDFLARMQTCVNGYGVDYCPGGRTKGFREINISPSGVCARLSIDRAATCVQDSFDRVSREYNLHVSTISDVI